MNALDEDTLFGPLTVRQFFYLGAGVVGAHAAYRILTAPTSYAVMVVIAAVVFVGIRNHPRVRIDAAYIAQKKANSTPGAYQRWLKMKIAMYKAYAMSRQSKGLQPNPKHEEIRVLLEAELAKEGGTPFEM
jgi:hypothetical protein